MFLKSWCLAFIIIATALFSFSISHTTSVPTIAAAQPSLPTIRVVPIEHSLSSLNSITSIVSYTDDTLLVSQKSGQIYLLKPPIPPATLWNATLFLDLSNEIGYKSELGFYSIAISPNFTSNQILYLSYINLDEDLVIERYNVASSTRSIVITIPKPNREDTDYHRAGHIEFYDGLLYISTGDNAIWEPYEVGHPSQNLNSLLGKILRIDVETGNPITYTIPSDNPYIGIPNHRPEIWAYGLRNPYKFAFDATTGNMLIGDVGNSLYEEINLIPTGIGGINFGWRCYEGPDLFPYYEPACANVLNTNAIHVYPHQPMEGRGRCSIIGGRLAQAKDYIALNGMYVYTDFCENRIRALRKESGIWYTYMLSDLPRQFYATAIGEDRNGTLYVGGLGREIYQVVEIPINTPPPIPKIIYLPLLHKN
jgi:glucose/arabinose dehydrogenase